MHLTPFLAAYTPKPALRFAAIAPDKSLPLTDSSPAEGDRGWVRDFLWQAEAQKKKRHLLFRWINGPLGVAILGGAALFLGGRVTQSYLKQHQLYNTAQTRMNPHEGTFSWPENTTILASTMQDDPSREDYISLNEPSLYSRRLFGALEDPRVSDLYGAQQKIETGFASSSMRISGTAQVPVSSTVHVPGWKKGEEKPRYVLLISGYGINGSTVTQVGDEEKYRMEKQILIDTSYVKHQLQKHYNIRDEKIKHLIQPSPRELYKTLEELEKQATYAPGAEILIYLAGHGSLVAQSRNIDPQKATWQGAQEGDIALTDSSSIGEIDLKPLLKFRLSKASAVYVVVNSCHAGAWIAQNSQKPRLPIDKMG